MRARRFSPPPAAALACIAAWALVVSIPAFSTVASAQNAKVAAPARAAAKASPGDEARGKYLVEQVAMCGQCHTPRDSQGNPDRSQWLQGGPVPWMPSQYNSNWPQQVPRIGGMIPATEAEMVKLLTTGVWITGAYLRPPMPQFRFTTSDAEAVVEYLKSVKSKP